MHFVKKQNKQKKIKKKITISKVLRIQILAGALCCIADTVESWCPLTMHFLKTQVVYYSFQWEKVLESFIYYVVMYNPIYFLTVRNLGIS